MVQAWWVGLRVGPELSTSDLFCHQPFLVGGLGERSEFILCPQFVGWQNRKRWAALHSTNPRTHPVPCLALPCQTLCFRVRKMIDVYKPDWCEVREDWSVYLFSPENK